jgi:hypothetical protein
VPTILKKYTSVRRMGQEEFDPEAIIEEDEFKISRESKAHLRRNYVLFAIFGAGTNWLLPTILFQQIPWFENRVPEGLCIATYLNTSNSFALIGTLTYCYVNKYHREIPHSITLPFILWLSVFGTLFAAFTYNYTVGGYSIFLFISTFMGATVGSLSAVVMNPFMTQFENIYITAARSGGSGSFLLCALLGIIQSPGSNTRFSPQVFLLIFAAFFLLPVLAYRTIIREKIGLRAPQPDSDTAKLRDMELSDMLGKKGAGKVSNKPEPQANPLQQHASSNEKSHEDAEDEEQISEVYHENDSLKCFNTSTFPWIHYTLPYALSIGFVNFNTWGMLSALTPFAMHHAANGVSDSFLLALCYEIGCFTLVAGDVSTAFVRFPFKIVLPMFGVLSFVIYLAAFKCPGFDTLASGPILVIVFCIGRFIEAHIVTECFRAIATHVPKLHREEASRALGIADQISTVLGVVSSTVLVSQFSSC